MSERADERPVVTYSFKEILEGINEKLGKNAIITEQLEKRIGILEERVATHDKILGEQIPKLTKFMEDMNVQKQVEDALDSRRVRGISTRDRVVVGALTACILAVSLLSALPHLIPGG